MKEFSVEHEKKQNPHKESFKYRSAAAFMLLVFTILFDVLELKPLGIDMKDIFEAIAENYIK